jgi:hypothetical protein
VEESARGAMFALGFNGARDVDGAMITAGLNLALHDVHGTQLAALANLALHDSDGLQLAGLVNFTSGDATFAQVSPLANIALGSMSGAQVGLVNFGGHIRGAQIGVVNVADHVDGTQVGVLNISNDASAPIGVLNIVREGQAHLGLYGSDVTPLGVQARLGSSFVYTTVQLGVNPLSGRDTRVHAALGPGVHLPFLAWGQGAFVDVEVRGRRELALELARARWHSAAAVPVDLRGAELQRVRDRRGERRALHDAARGRALQGRDDDDPVARPHARRAAVASRVA